MCRVKARVLQGKPAVTDSVTENKLPAVNAAGKGEKAV